MKFLKPGGRLVAVASTQWRERVTKDNEAFSDLLASLGAQVQDIPRGAFKESGTDIPTTLIAFEMPAAATAAQAATAHSPQLRPHVLQAAQQLASF